MALAAFTIIATTGLLAACSSGHSGKPVAQKSPQASSTPVSQPAPVSQPSTASPGPAAQSQHRPAAEHLDAAKYSMVTVRYKENDGIQIDLRKQIRSPAVIARLTRIVNGLPGAKPGSTTCPAASITYQMMFTGIGSAPDTTVTTRSCPADLFSQNGKLQQPVWDRSGAVAAQVKRLMHIRHSHVTYDPSSNSATIPPGM